MDGWTHIDLKQFLIKFQIAYMGTMSYLLITAAMKYDIWMKKKSRLTHNFSEYSTFMLRAAGVALHHFFLTQK